MTLVLKAETIPQRRELLRWPTLLPSSRLDVEGLQLLEVTKALFFHEGLDVGVGPPA